MDAVSVHLSYGCYVRDIYDIGASFNAVIATIDYLPNTSISTAMALSLIQDLHENLIKSFYLPVRQFTTTAKALASTNASQ